MLNPYNYSFNTTSDTYQFTTKNNMVYSVVFVEDETLNSLSTAGIEFDNVYQIIIEKKTDKVDVFDSQVSLTIESIIDDFFTNIKNALIYICSEDKGKETQRFKAFNRWYDNSKHKNVITKVDNVIELEDIEKSEEIKKSIIYTSLLFHKSNPNAIDILNTFNEIEKVLNSEK